MIELPKLLPQKCIQIDENWLVGHEKIAIAYTEAQQDMINAGYRPVPSRSEFLRVIATAIIEWEINKPNISSLADYITDAVRRWLMEKK